MTTIFEKYGYRHNAGGGGLNLSGTDPQAVGEELQNIKNDHDGKLYPSDVVEGAKIKSSPLHDIFEWEDTEAARRYRLYQARCLIKTVVVISRTEDKPTKTKSVFVNVISKEGRDPVDDQSEPKIYADQHYVDRTTATSTPAYRDQMVNRALRELKSWRDRYEDFNEFSLVFSAIDRTEAKLKK